MPAVAKPPGARPRPPRPPSRPTVHDRPGRWQMVVRRQRRLLLPMGLAFGAFVIGVGALSGLHALGDGETLGESFGRVTAGMGLRVQHIVIEGRVKTPEALVHSALGLNIGDSILGFSVANARARLESVQWVRAASVTRRLPDTVVVRLKERSPFAVWQHDGRFVLIDHDGQTVTDSDLGAFAGQLPLVVGAGAPAAAAALIDALAAQPAIFARVVASIRVGERRWNLRLQNGTDVMLPEGAEPQALARLMELQTSHQLLDRPLQALDLRLPDRLVFRPLPQHGGETKDNLPVPPQQPRKPT